MSHDPWNIETLLIGWSMLTSSIISALVKEKVLNKRYYDRTAKPLAPLLVDDNVRRHKHPIVRTMKSCPGRNRFLIIDTDGITEEIIVIDRKKLTYGYTFSFGVVIRGCLIRYLAPRKRFEFLTDIRMTII